MCLGARSYARIHLVWNKDSTTPSWKDCLVLEVVRRVGARCMTSKDVTIGKGCQAPKGCKMSSWYREIEVHRQAFPTKAWRQSLESCRQVLKRLEAWQGRPKLVGKAPHQASKQSMFGKVKYKTKSTNTLGMLTTYNTTQRHNLVKLFIVFCTTFCVAIHL